MSIASKPILIPPETFEILNIKNIPKVADPYSVLARMESSHRNVGIIMKYFGIIIAVVAVAGCESKIQPKMEASQVNLSREACLDNLAYPGCIEYLGNLEADFTITHAKPLVADSGETVMIRGENFTEGMRVKVNGQEVSASVISETEASFVMPDGLTNGKVDALAQKYDKKKPFLLYAWVDDTYPLITKEPSEVCQGEKYYNAAGEILEGAKDCGDSALA